MTEATRFGLGHQMAKGGRRGERNATSECLFAAAQAGKLAAKYTPADPAFWVQQMGYAGLAVYTDGERLAVDVGDTETVERAVFLDKWLRHNTGRRARRGEPSGCQIKLTAWST
jgi:hypothetical protein